jgi:hypothetical protein
MASWATARRSKYNRDGLDIGQWLITGKTKEKIFTSMENIYYKANIR